MRYATMCLALVFSFVSVEPLWAAEKNIPTYKKKVIVVPPGGLTGGVTGGLGKQPGVIEYNESDCRIDGGEVVTPGDSRCGSLGAKFCRGKDGVSRCLTEQ